MACPRDVLDYKHEEYHPFNFEDTTPFDDCIHGQRGCDICTKACPRFRAWERVDELNVGELICPALDLVVKLVADGLPRHREHAESVAQEFGIEHVANDWKELVARDDVDLVSVVTPPATHMEIVLAALEHGKAVLCEKPTA